MKSGRENIFWIDGLKAFAIIGILLNHLVESFGNSPWFSNPSYSWPGLSIRLSMIFPSEGILPWRIFQFLGYLGDMGPGVFILVSGFALTLSSLNRGLIKIPLTDFYLRRLGRIFPLYITIHLLILIAGKILETGPDPTSRAVFLSMLGLRFADKLFFFINPSWWFIWLILQLYVLFPFLYRLLIKRGIMTFSILALGFTVLSRLAGLLHLTWSDHLEYWMTGLFFGTRLSEFAAGMILAKLYTENKLNPENFGLPKQFFLSIVIYITGFVLSLFYISTLFSNSLITIGLTGIFLSFCRFIQQKTNFLVNTVKWIGVYSFPVFLLHQPIMLWAGMNSSGPAKVIGGVLVIILSFLAGWLIENTVNLGISALQKSNDHFKNPFIKLIIALQILLNLVYFITASDLVRRIDAGIFIFNIFFLMIYFLSGNRMRGQSYILLGIIPSSILFQYILPYNWFGVFWIFILILFIAITCTSVLSKYLVIRIAASFAITLIILLSAEFLLRRERPVEVTTWGELPALQKDTSTVYSLIPGKVTHLKYNNYDYFTKTNSLGFNGPEINPGLRDSNEFRILLIGDAFTMPEGMEYEQAYPELLQSGLRKAHPDKKVTVFNAGVTGYGPNEMYAQLVKYVDIIKPDIFINQLFINELSEIDIEPEARLNSIGLRPISLTEKYLINCQFPTQVNFHFHRLINDQQYKAYTYRKSLADYYEIKSDLYQPGTVHKITDYLKKVKSVCETEACHLIVLFAPGQLEISSPEDIDYYPSHLNLADTLIYDLHLPGKVFGAVCDEIQIPYLDPSSVLKAHPVQPVYFRGSWHWNEEGHKVIAGYLENVIQKILR